MKRRVSCKRWLIINFNIQKKNILTFFTRNIDCLISVFDWKFLWTGFELIAIPIATLIVTTSAINRCVRSSSPHVAIGLIGTETYEKLVKIEFKFFLITPYLYFGTLKLSDRYWCFWVWGVLLVYLHFHWTKYLPNSSLLDCPLD